MPLETGEVLALDTREGVLYAAGRTPQGPTVAQVNACTGEPLRQTTLDDDALEPSASINGVLLHGDELTVVGATRGLAGGVAPAYVGTLRATTLAQRTLMPLAPGAGRDELWGVARAPSGRLLFTGGRDVDGASGAAWWSLRGASPGALCAFEVDPPPSTFGRAAAYGGGRWWMGGSRDNRPALVDWAEDCGGVDAPNCGCLDAVTRSIDLPETDTGNVRAFALHGDQVVLAGLAVSQDNMLGFVARAPMNGGAPVVLLRHDPTPRLDAFVDLAVTGDRAFVSGIIDFDGADWLSGRAVVFEVGIADGAVRRVLDFGPGGARSVRVDEQRQALYVQLIGGGTRLARCPIDGPCP